MSSQIDQEVKNLSQTIWADKSIAEKYARGETVTGPFGRIMVEKSGLPTYKGDATVLDLATGTGVVVANIYDLVPKDKQSKLKVVAGDISPPMLAYVKERGEKNGWTGLETQTHDGNDLKLAPNSFTHAFVSFGIFVMAPDTTQKLCNAVKPGGAFGLTSWKSFAWYDYLARAVEQLSEPIKLPSQDEVKAAMYKGAAWSDESYIKKTLEDAGLKNVEVQAITDRSEAGTPAIFCETMTLPMKLIGMFFPEDKRDQYVKDILGKVEEILVQEVGGADELVLMDWEGIVAVGQKPE